MNIISTIRLDFAQDTPPVFVFAKQGDQESRFVEIVPLNGGLPYTLEAGIDAKIGATKPDGTTVLNNCTISDGKIYAPLTAQTLAAFGIVKAEIGLFQNDSLLSSQVFYVNVRQSAYDPNVPLSSNEFAALVEAFYEVNNLDIWAEQTATGATIYIKRKDGTVQSVHIDTATSIKTWDDIKYAVRNGLGPVLFPVGYEFTTPRETDITAAVGAHNTGVTAASVDEDTFLHAIGGAHDGHYEATFDGDEWRDEHGDIVDLTDYGITITGTPATDDKIIISETAGDIVWQVYDHITEEVEDALNPADRHYRYGMILGTKYVYSNAAGTQIGVVFDDSEALFYCDEALAAGTYNFTWDYETGSVTNGTFQFTLTQGVPAGGQICMTLRSNGSAITAATIFTLAHPGDSAKIEENVAISAGNSGTSLGTIHASSVEGTGLNCAQRIVFGSNNYAQSAMRQWLNSDKDLGQVWSAQTKFDRAPSWHTSNDKAYRGWMHGFGDDFLGAILTAKVPCRTNSYFETDSLDGTEFAVNETYDVKDKFFLLSAPEYFGTYDSASLKDGVLLDYYDGLTQAERIKRDKGGAARYTWLRSPNPWHAGTVRSVNTDGSLYNSGAIGGHGVAPACIIG